MDALPHNHLGTAQTLSKLSVRFLIKHTTLDCLSMLHGQLLQHREGVTVPCRLGTFLNTLELAVGKQHRLHSQCSASVVFYPSAPQGIDQPTLRDHEQPRQCGAQLGLICRDRNQCRREGLGSQIGRKFSIAHALQEESQHRVYVTRIEDSERIVVLTGLDQEIGIWCRMSDLFGHAT